MPKLNLTDKADCLIALSHIETYVKLLESGRATKEQKKEIEETILELRDALLDAQEALTLEKKI